MKISKKDAQQPRVQNNHRPQRVPICTKTPQATTTPSNNPTHIPNYISDDDSDDKESKHASITTLCHYSTRAQKQLHGSITTDTMLELLELSQTELSIQTLAT